MRKALILLFISLITLIVNAQNAKNSLVFDGVDDYVQSTWSGISGTGGRTVEAWIKTTVNANSNQQIITDWGSNTTGGRFTFNVLYSNAIRLEVNGSGVSGHIAVNDGKWHHVVGIYNPSATYKFFLYVDGVLDTNANNTTTVNTGSSVNFRIGARIDNAKFFTGSIDEVRVYNTVVDNNTLNSWASKPIDASHPYYSNILAYFKLDEGTGTTTYDSSQTYASGTLTNFGTNPWAVSYVPMISRPTNFKQNVDASYPARPGSSSSIMSVSSSMSGNSYVVYGHNSNPLNYNSVNKPAIIQKRVSRIWRVEKEGSPTGTITFDYSSLDTSGFNSYRLLISSDTNFANANVIYGTKIGNQKIRFSNISFQDSVYLTIGAINFMAPIVKTQSIDERKAFSVKVTGNVTEDGGYTTYRGIVWSTSANPDTSLSTKMNFGTGMGTFQATITGLNPNTTYHVRAFAYNSLGLSYGADSTVTTLTAYTPTVVTAGYTTIYADSLIYKGTVTFDGNAAISDRGFCWSTTANPTTALTTKMSIGTGTGNFTGMITGLNPGTTYHIRAFAVNQIGTSYGADSTVTTLSIFAPTVITGAVTSITGFTASVAGTISFDGRRTITQKGFCWSTSPNPTTALTTVSNQGTGNSAFNYTITGLAPNTTYYVRAYAINAVGTSYGADSIFHTADKPTVILESISGIGYYSANVSSRVVSNNGQPVTSRGICWGYTQNPTISSGTFKTSGSGNGMFATTMTGLNQNTSYHVRSFAINSVDTAYSPDSVFTTKQQFPPTLSTQAVSSVTANSAKCGGNVTSDGGTSVTARGICWSVNPNPEANLSTKSNNGAGLGLFYYTMTGLARGTVYHVRAYAINAIDTAYGGDTVFSTLNAPTVTTDSVKMINANTVETGGTITSDGGSVVLRRGVCYDTKPNPTARLSTITIDGFGSGHYTSTVTFLAPGTTYYFRAYAINAIDTAYGGEVSFTTYSLPVVTTASVSAITGFSAVCGGNATSGDSITSKGVVWSTSMNPTIALSTKTSDGSGLGSFVSNITNLLPNTKYYVRAYATNITGTTYGSEVNFTTAGKATVSTSNPSVISSSSVQSGGMITSDGGMNVTQRGVCWSVNPTPFVTGNKTTDGSGTGSFTSTITGLNQNTTYYIRAYAINAVDTAYGNEKTVIITPPSASTFSANNISKNEADLSGTVNAKGQITNVTFEYGLTTAYGSSIAAIPGTVSSSVNENVTAHLTGLTESTLYHYRVVAESSHGKTYGNDTFFTTKSSAIHETDAGLIFQVISKENVISINLQNSGNETAFVSVFDALGKEILSDKFVSNYSFNSISGGFYLIVLNFEGHIGTYRVIAK